MTTISLCMIVKDESAVITRCLESVLPIIHSWTVVDTGSGDNTPDLVQSFLGHLPGKLHHRPWTNFALARSQAFELDRGQSDYHLVIDADDWLEMERDFRLPLLSGDCYQLKIRHGATVYLRPQLFRAALPWKYVGVVHEFAECASARPPQDLSGLIYVHNTGEGARSRNPNKYLDDARLLEQALQDCPNDPRSVFYLAQSYRDGGAQEQALEAYLQRTRLGGWSEERYISHLERARLLRKRAADRLQIQEELLQAIEINPLRAEAFMELAQLYRAGEQWNLAHFFASAAMGLGLPAGLFLEESIYQWGAEDEVALADFYLERKGEAATRWRKLLKQAVLPAADRKRIEKNLSFCCTD